jgi:hypothetical protein
MKEKKRVKIGTPVSLATVIQVDQLSIILHIGVLIKGSTA